MHNRKGNRTSGFNYPLDDIHDSDEGVEPTDAELAERARMAKEQAERDRPFKVIKFNGDNSAVGPTESAGVAPQTAESEPPRQPGEGGV